jgi:hypothetical protein
VPVPRRVAPILVLVCVLATAAIVWLGLLRIDLDATPFRDLAPQPDATEYVAGGWSLMHEHDYVLHIAGRTMPPRFPPGYSIVLAGAMLLGVEPVRAPFAVNTAATILLLLLVLAAGAAEGSLLAGSLAVLLLAATPGFLTLARSPMSEPVSFLLLFLGHWLLYRYVRLGRLAPGIAATVLLGLAVAVRFANVFFAFAPLLAVLSATGLSPRRRLVHLLAFGGGLAAGIAPLLAYDAAAFGHPLGNGYQVWVPQIASLSTGFGFEHLLPNLRLLLVDAFGGDKPFSVGDLFGPGIWFGPCTMFLFLGAAVLGVRERRERWFWCSAAVYCAIMLAHWVWEARYQLAPLPFACVLAGMRLTQLRWGTAWRARAFAVVAALAACGHVLGVPGHKEASDLVTELRTWKLHGEAQTWHLIQSLAPRLHDGDLVLSEWNPPCMHALIGKQVTVSPLRFDGDYSYHPAVFRYGPVEQQEQIASTLAHGGSVHALFERDDANALPALRGRTWVLLDRRGTGSLYAMR